MPTVNPLDLPPDIAEMLQELCGRYSDPMELAVACWNASFEYTQGDRDVTNN